MAKRVLIGQDSRGKFTKEALRKQTKRVLAGKAKIIVVKPGR